MMAVYYIFTNTTSINGRNWRLMTTQKASSPKKALQKVLDQTEFPPDNYTSTGVNDSDYVVVKMSDLRGYSTGRGGLL